MSHGFWAAGLWRCGGVAAGRGWREATASHRDQRFAGRTEHRPAICDAGVGAANHTGDVREARLHPELRRA